MIGLIIYWDVHPDYVSVSGGAKRWLSSYIFTMEAFGADKLFIIGKPGISHGYNIQHTEHDTLDGIFQANSNAKIVALVGSVPQGITKVSLKDYIHPEEDVLYVIGGDYSDIEFDVCKANNADFVNISNGTNSPNLWSNVVAGIALRDRYIKGL